MLSIAAAAAGLLSLTLPSTDALGGKGIYAPQAHIMPAPSAENRGARSWFDRLNRGGVEKRNPLAPITWAFYAGPAFPGPREERRPRMSPRAILTLLALIVLNAVVLGVCLALLTEAAPLAKYFPVLIGAAVLTSIGVSVLAVRRASRVRRKKPSPRIAWPSGFSSSS